jgi:endogenous inhibitor of DNA gyrase (YacG/DUF329 family)
MNTEDDNLKDEGPQEIDLAELGGEDESETVPCPACGAEIYEDAARCPSCGEYVTIRQESPARSGRWKWLVALGVAVGVVLWVSHC